MIKAQLGLKRRDILKLAGYLGISGVALGSISTPAHAETLVYPFDTAYYNLTAKGESAGLYLAIGTLQNAALGAVFKIDAQGHLVVDDYTRGVSFNDSLVSFVRFTQDPNYIQLWIGNFTGHLSSSDRTPTRIAGIYQSIYLNNQTDNDTTIYPWVAVNPTHTPPNFQ